jgi:hypothetical protein
MGSVAYDSVRPVRSGAIDAQAFDLVFGEPQFQENLSRMFPNAWRSAVWDFGDPNHLHWTVHSFNARAFAMDRHENVVR